MRKLHIDLRLSQETIDDLAAGKSVVIEDAEDRFVLIPPQEMDCDYGVHDVEEEEDSDDEDDSFEIAQRMQKMADMLVDIQNRAYERSKS